MLAVASSLVSKCVPPRWVFWPVLVFVVGLVVIWVSLLLAKHRELKRRDAAKANQTEPDLTGWLWRSDTWGTISLMLLVLASVVALVRWSGINLGL
jgi:hypothetical protein